MTTTSVPAHLIEPGDRLHWQHDAVDVAEVIVDIRTDPHKVVVVGTVVRTDERQRLHYEGDEWVTITRPKE